MENKNLFTNTFMKVTRIEEGIGCDAWYTCVAFSKGDNYVFNC